MYQEKDNVELKRELTDAVKNEIIAFLNTKGGTIYVGVDDNGELYRPFINEDKDYIDTKLANWIEDTIYPVPMNDVKHYFNDDGVLAIDVSEGNSKPYYLKEKGPRPSGVYKRVGSSIRKASEDEILRMIMSSRGYIYENDISEEQSLTFKSLYKEFKDNGFELNERNMISLGIMNAKKQYTNLGLILSDQSDITVRIAEYDKERNFKLKKQLTGSLVELFHNVKEQTDRMNNVSARIDVKTYRRIETASYPGVSLREIILNAFIHADYFIRSNIKIEFFEDRCRITSPGGIYNASMEEIMKGVQTYRNRGLVNIFDKLGLIENFGTGILRTFDAYKGEKRQPVFEATDNFFYVTLPNLNYHENDEINDEINDKINKSLNSTDLEILKTINQHPGIKVDRIEDILNSKGVKTNKNQIRNSIRRKIASYITYKGSNKTGGYYLL